MRIYLKVLFPSLKLPALMPWTVRQIGLTSTPDNIIAKTAQETDRCIVTGDFDFADIRRYPPEEYHGIIAFHILPAMTGIDILELVKRFLQCDELLQDLSKKLVIVDSSKIRVRSGKQKY